MIKTIARPNLKSPILICAWPGMGEVASKAALHMKETLAFRELAHLEAFHYFEPSGVFIKNSVLEMPKPAGGAFYYYKNPHRTNDVILFISDAQPNLGSAITYAEEIMKFAKAQGIKFIYTFAAMTVPIDHLQDPNVWIAVTTRRLLSNFRSFNMKLLKEGQISGLNGLILGVAKSQNIDGACLLGEIPLYTIQIENPKASAAVLGIINRYLRLGLDLNPLIEKAKFVDAEINKLIGYIKGDIPTSGPLSEDDIEKIKKELSAFTKLPESARKRIENLFKLAAKDITMASDLKRELDTWSVFKDYEDRFLDLFKKKERD